MTNELTSIASSSSHQNPQKKKRNLPGTPDPEAEVISLSPKTLMATNRFLCEICGKGFQRDQNLQLHRRGHNLPWKLKQRTSKEVRKRVYVCPEKSCVHHHPSRALGDLTGIKKHYCRKHGDKKWKCDKCDKRYAVHSDWKAHSKTCGTREYKCDCGTIFSRRDSFITHRAFCDALAEETARYTAASQMNNHHVSILNHHFIGSSIDQPAGLGQHYPPIFKPNSINSNDQNIDPTGRGLPLWMAQNLPHHLQDPMSKNVQEFNPIGLHNFTTTTTHNNIINPPPFNLTNHNPINSITLTNNVNEAISVPSLFSTQNQSQIPTNANISATALLQKASQYGSVSSAQDVSKLCGLYGSSSGTSGLGSDVECSVNDLSALTQMEMNPPLTKRRRLANNKEITNEGGETRDFLGVGIQSIGHPSSINGWI
ncbi:hypothetical protein CASFOL_008099 [Castilleja foliolosa]|uniref:C2H2-type domain-containing protein n=1 Tax=Castilleja foliolosa TaxID=1961234 RepID=A0ABD3DZA1_9LAMI